MVSTRTRRTRRQRFLSAVTAGFLLAGVTAAVADDGRTPDSASSTGAGASAEPGGLGLSLGALLGRALGATDLLAPARLGRLRVPGDVDGVGLGTYTASVLFQVAPKAHVTAVDVYRKGRVDRAAVGDALQWARDHAKDLDAVVLAFPPASLLDPMAAGLAGGETRTVGTDAAASASASASERTAAALAGGWAKLRD